VNAYALAAGAAGVAVIALGQSAEADIVVTHAHGNVPINKYVSIDLNHDGIPDFRFTISFSGYHFFGGTLRVRPQGAGGLMATAGGYAAVLSQGASIGSGQAFTAGKPIRMARTAGFDYNSVYSRNFFGPWDNVQNRFLGVEFLIGGATHYGWVRVTVSDAHIPMTATVTGYAYETIAGQSIQAGQMIEQASAPVESVPFAKPSLGLLALGSQGLELWRRESLLLSAQYLVANFAAPTSRLFQSKSYIRLAPSQPKETL
jgi:hypothetical protein